MIVSHCLKTAKRNFRLNIKFVKELNYMPNSSILAKNLIQMRKVLIFNIFILAIVVSGFSQTIDDEFLESNIQRIEISGSVLDLDTKMPLPYTNIYVKHKHIGVISNENGQFSLDITFLEPYDTIRFQYIGYITKLITVSELDSLSPIYLKENIINLSETLIFGSAPDAKSVVKKVLKYKDQNYKKSTNRKQIFIRERYLTDFVKVKLNYKKSSISELNEEFIEFVEEKIPKQSTSYIDFLGNVYSSNNKEDSIKVKVDPIRTVSLKEEDFAELDKMEKIFKNTLKQTMEDEYWKVKTGIFSQKLDLDDDYTDSIAKKDTIPENYSKTKYINWRVSSRLKYSTLDDEDQWEFLHNTGKYKYTLAGGTRVNGEDVYIIDFEPKGGGTYKGRMFITILTHALIRADYEYAPEKTGKDIHLFGIGYTETQFSGSIYFEKGDSTYNLKYFSYNSGSQVSFERSVSLLKKRKRFLFDKKLKEIKIGIDFSVENTESVEYLVLNESGIVHQDFLDFDQKKYMEIIQVDQFNDNLWKGYSIIEPTKHMKEYKKQELDFKL